MMRRAAAVRPTTFPSLNTMTFASSGSPNSLVWVTGISVRIAPEDSFAK